jgi:tetratricopeptide (TPR) repeat protein
MSKKKHHSKSSVRPRPVPAPPEREKKLPNAFRRKVVLVALFLFFISFLYWDSLKNDFINWDDQMIYGNQAIRSLDWRNVLQMFVPGKGTYQPIRVLSYAIDYKFWGLNPLGYHLTSVFFYLLTCIVIFFTSRLLSKNILPLLSAGSHNRIAFFTAFLFAAHPVHVEAVTWLAARKEVLQGFFLFFSFYLYLQVRESQEAKKRLIYIGSVLLTFLLAILSKPSAVVLPGLLILYEVARQGSTVRSLVKERWLFFSISGAFSLLFSLILFKAMGWAGSFLPFYGGSLSTNLIVSVYLILYNIKLLAFTTGYSAAYTITASFKFFSKWTLAAFGLTFLLFVIALWSRKKTSVFFFTFFWFFIAVLPFLNIIPITVLLADRYVFIASFGYCLLLGFFFNSCYEVKKGSEASWFFKGIAVSLFILLISEYSYLTFCQNRIWRDSYTLWSDAVRKYPEGNLANAMMGLVYMEKGKDEEAVKYLKKAVRIRPIDVLSLNNLAITYWRLGQPEEALKAFTTAVRLEPDDDSIKLNLSVFYQSQKEYKRSEEILKNLLMKDPNNGNLRLRLGHLYKKAGQFREAIAEFGKSAELIPQSANSYEELGNIYLNVFGNSEKAIYNYTQAIKAAKEPNSKIDELRWTIQDLECYR